jgi:Protein of unknown function DUF86
VSPETRSAVQSVPWADAILMRNRLVHAYFDIDHMILWKTATEDIPSPALAAAPVARSVNCPRVNAFIESDLSLERVGGREAKGPVDLL